MKHLATIIAIASSFCSMGALAAPSYVFQTLGNFGTDSSGRGYSNSQAINASGQVVGGSLVWDAAGNFKGDAAFLWNGSSLQNLGNFGTDSSGIGNSYGQAINASGQVVGFSGVYDAAGNDKGQAAFLHDGLSLNKLDDLVTLPSGLLSIESVIAINDAGQITGRARFLTGTQAGEYTAFLMTPASTSVPIPGTVLLLGLGLLGLGYRRTRFAGARFLGS